MLSGADMQSKCPGNKIGTLDGQVCRGMPLCVVTTAFYSLVQ